MNIATPIYRVITIKRTDATGFQSSVLLDPDDPIFKGHYPDSPIYPGVCLIELACRAAAADALDRGHSLELAEILSARFTSPVFPGDCVLLVGDSSNSKYAIDIFRNIDRSVVVGRVRLRYREEGFEWS